MVKQSDFMYVYDAKLFKYLKFEKNIPFITSGLNEKTLLKFWQFYRTPELNAAMEEYQSKQR
jgi:hypothetical protein